MATAGGLTTAIRHLTWYFDVISPYSYLQFHEFRRRGLFTRDDVKVTLKPVIFSGLLDHWRNVGPAEVPPKKLWTMRLCLFIAEQNQIPMTIPTMHPFNSVPLLRLCIEHDCTVDIVDRMLSWVWRDGHVPGHGAAWDLLLREVGSADSQVFKDPNKRALWDNKQAAIKDDVWGVPSSVVDGNVFFGYDGTPMLLAYLNNDKFFQTKQFIKQVPPGIERAGRYPVIVNANM
ncbi:DSBA-like thioredoxin domain-containing protein [Plasmodiophora brassicae]|uniref:DSBA-like thioredoxin domain-containing protein n=1 Tax=Plasmodiophora brassicae TaxID=37360 RepID=A0A3P3XZK8_PLABS|nr:unnamed protein product [Plasmodiophora brassicae]